MTICNNRHKLSITLLMKRNWYEVLHLSLDLTIVNNIYQSFIQFYLGFKQNRFSMTMYLNSPVNLLRELGEIEMTETGGYI